MTLPTFMLIGAMKAGTTSVWNYLDQHPDIFMSRLKEPSFFSFPPGPTHFSGLGDDARAARRPATLEAYEALFEEVAGERAVGEASTVYLYCPGTAERIKAVLPEVRLIAILRQPADRAFANYTQVARSGDEPLRRFEDALAAEEERRRAGWDPVWCYWDRGRYAEQLRRYRAVFDRSQLHITLFDDLVADPIAFMESLYRFVGVDPRFVPDVSRRFNVGGRPRSFALNRFLRGGTRLRRLLRPLARTVLWTQGQRDAVYRWLVRSNRGTRRLDPVLREALTAGYRDDIAALEQLIGRDLSHWTHT